MVVPTDGRERHTVMVWDATNRAHHEFRVLAKLLDAQGHTIGVCGHIVLKRKTDRHNLRLQLLDAGGKLAAEVRLGRGPVAHDRRRPDVEDSSVVSTDGGKTWARAESGTQRDLNAGVFTGEKSAVAVGAGGMVRKK